MSKAQAGRLRPISAVSIGASDSGGGAGIQADLLTFAAHGVYGATVLAGATAQDTHGVRAVEAFSGKFVARQMDAVFRDLRPRAVKIGALIDLPAVRAVACGLSRYSPPNVVVDPVLATSSGTRLLSRRAVAAFKRELLPLCDLLTPNLPEAEELSGISIRDDGDLRRAAGILSDLGPDAVLITGGHAAGAEVRDLLFDGRRFLELRHLRIRTRATHGTGCTLAAAITANLALGCGLEVSVRRAIHYLRAGMKRGLFPGHGAGVPDHFPGAKWKGSPKS